MLSKCCFWVPLRTGSILIAILGLLIAIATLVYSGGSWLYIILGSYYLIAEATLLFGAITCNKRAMLVYLVCSAIFPFIDIVFGIIAIISIDTIIPDEYLNIYKDPIAMTVVFCVAGSLMNIYFWLCNYSFYKKLKKRKPMVCLV